jgi:hypothetical protein
MVDSIPITPHGLQMGENEKKLFLDLTKLLKKEKIVLDSFILPVASKTSSSFFLLQIFFLNKLKICRR